MVKCGICRTRRPGESKLWRVKPVTLKEYRRALARLLAWLDENNTTPSGAQEWDESACKYCALECLSHGQMGTLIAALEFCFPRFKRHLVVTRADAEGMLKDTPIVHKHPLCRGPASLFAAHGASRGIPRVGVALIVQQAAGLRPMELLILMPENILFQDSLLGQVAILKLGSIVHTKARREQVAYIYLAGDPNAYKLLTQLVDAVPAGCRLFDFSYNYYNKFISECCSHFELDIVFTGHSARAGFASERVARGESETEVQRRGRWRSASSFAVYVDIVLAAQIDVSFKLAGLNDAMIYCHVYLLQYFSKPALVRPTHVAFGRAKAVGSKIFSKEATLADARSSIGGRAGTVAVRDREDHKEGGQGTSQGGLATGRTAAAAPLPDFLGPSAAALRAAGNAAESAALPADRLGSKFAGRDNGRAEGRQGFGEGSTAGGKGSSSGCSQGSKGRSEGRGKGSRSIRPPQKR